MSVFERARLVGFGLLAATFLAGALAGAAIDRALVDDDDVAHAEEQDRDDRGERDRRYIIDRVQMSGEQRAAIDSILERRVHRMRAVWQEVEPRLDAITDSARAEIMDVLTAEQRAEYETMLERARREWRENGDGNGDERGDPDGGGD